MPNLMDTRQPDLINRRNFEIERFRELERIASIPKYAFVDNPTFVRFNRKVHPKRKKPLRLKKPRKVTRCSGCGVHMDPNGNLHSNTVVVSRYGGVRSGVYCNKCFKMRFFTCTRCQRTKNIYRRDPKNKRLCRMCVHDLIKTRHRSRRRTVPMNPRDVSWSQGNRIHAIETALTGSKRAFGIEIETATCPFVERLQHKTAFGAKYDATCTGREFVSPILGGDEGLQTVCDFCDHAKRRGWKVDDNCGVHIHLDMSQENHNTAQRIAVAYLLTYTSWAKLVDPRRLTNAYCMPPTPSAHYVQNHDDFEYLCNNSNRYEFINLSAFRRHRTIEIRGLEGSLDKALITNWIKAHLAFADFAATSSYQELNSLFGGTEVERWHNLKQHIGSTARYFGRVRAKWNQ